MFPSRGINWTMFIVSIWTRSLPHKVAISLRRLWGGDEGWVVIGGIVVEVLKGDIIESIDGSAPEEWMSNGKLFLTVPHRRTRETQWQHIVPTLWNVHEATLRVRARDDKVREFKYSPSRLDAHDPRADRSKKGQEHTDSHRWWTETSPSIGHLRRRHMDRGSFTILPDGTGARCEGGWAEPSGRLFEGRIIGLINRYVGSAAEDFIMPWKDTGRGTLRGGTWGSTGQPVFIDYQGVHVGVGSVRAHMPDGTPFEGIGIAPDISIGRTRDALYAGRGPVREAALE